ncbi:hypothetical protein K439DRAFT_1645669 [Ramaria rubella]|nr:hypothetical protein K439DRAFT_1645669 [Ramaria rubella]
MLTFLRFYNCSNGTNWREASLLSATAAEEDKQLPVSLYGIHNQSRITDEDLAEELHLHLQSLNKKYLQALDVVQYFNSPEVKSRLKIQKTPSECTAHHWMHVMRYRYRKAANGMYVDGHECDDVVEYHTNIFLPFCAMPTFPEQKCIVLVTHDKSTFYENDRCKTHWVHATEKPEPVRKGEGSSLMVSDFASPDLGWLKSKDGLKEAHIIFKAGKNQDGYFDCDDLCSQIELAIELFEDNFPGTAVAAFGFDNAPGHQKSRYVPKFPKVWLGKKGKCRMRHGTLPNGQPQDFYFPDTHPDMPGMKLIIEERGFKEGSLPAECKHFKCKDSTAACCCRRLLFNQPDFASQKPAIVELIESHGHIAFFYPKFHCELNFIEQCWGAAKYQYQMLPLTENEAAMEKNVGMCLDGVDLLKHSVVLIIFNRFANRSARFTHAYQQGLNGTQASWVNKKYHRHRVPESILQNFDIMPNKP